NSLIDNKTACDKRNTKDHEGNRPSFHVDITQIRLNIYISYISNLNVTEYLQKYGDLFSFWQECYFTASHRTH
ncbi:MAG: hypothetical protein WB474_01485, partial [Nitrososphaeraceae archaeon]